MADNVLYNNSIVQSLISETYDINCNVYNNIINQRLTAIARQNMISITDNNNITRRKFCGGGPGGGTTFNVIFPSKCNYCLNVQDKITSSDFTCIRDSNVGIYDILINKKGYMFKNVNGSNVISGPIEYIKNGNREYLLQFGGTSGAGLTLNKQLSNIGKGLTRSGLKSKKYGVQSFGNSVPTLLSRSNIFEDYQPTRNAPSIETPRIFNTLRPFIPICISKTI